MTRIAYDGINSDAAAIPAAAAIVAGYVDGLYVWSDADWARFPHAVKVRIAVFSQTDDGHVLDCEQGNATPPQSVDWVLMRRKAGVDPTVYCGRNTWWQQIRAAFQARSVPEPHYWVADYSVNQADPQIPAGAVALQYTDTGPYDLSVVADYWPGVDPPQGAGMPLTNADADVILNRPVPRAGGGETGETTLGSMVAWNDAHVQGLGNQIVALSKALAALSAQVAKLSTGNVDVAALAAALAAQPALAQSVAHDVAVELHKDTPAS